MGVPDGAAAPPGTAIPRMNDPATANLDPARVSGGRQADGIPGTRSSFPPVVQIRRLRLFRPLGSARGGRAGIGTARSVWQPGRLSTCTGGLVREDGAQHAYGVTADVGLGKGWPEPAGGGGITVFGQPPERDWQPPQWAYPHLLHDEHDQPGRELAGEGEGLAGQPGRERIARGQYHPAYARRIAGYDQLS